MSDPEKQIESSDEVTDSDLEGVQGGNSIDKVPNPRTPKRMTGSIAQGEINSNSTDDNLSDSGGGIIT